jgi:large subunit ribosomal protein L25
MYGGGQAPTGVAFDANALHRNMAEEAFLSSILTVTLDGKEMQAIVRDYQPHPAKRAILHLDLQRVVATEKLRMTIPLHFINEELSPGVKLGGASVSHLLTELEISCLPKDLPEYIEVDIAPMQLNDMLHIRDLKLPAGVEVPGFEANSDSDLPVVHVHVLRAAEEPAAEAGAEGAAAAPAAAAPAAAADKAGDKAGGDKAKAAAKPAAKGDKK